MLARFVRTLLVLSCMGLLPACATVVSGTTQTITVDTKPSGARCDLSRGDDKVGVVNPTPGSITIGKSLQDMEVACSKEGYLTERVVMRSEFQAATLGNVLIGGVIGIAIDAGSGAMSKYEPLVTLTLPPATFDTAADRDEFFAMRRKQTIEAAEMELEEIGNQCSGEDCIRRKEIVNKAREERLKHLDKQLSQSRVRQ